MPALEFAQFVDAPPVLSAPDVAGRAGNVRAASGYQRLPLHLRKCDGVCMQNEPRAEK